MVCTVQTDGLFTPYRPSVLKESMHSFFPFPFGLCFRTGFLLRDTVRSGRIFLRLFSFQPFQLPLVPKEQFIPFVEILLEDDAYTLSGEVGLGVIAVVGFVIRFQTDIAGTVYEPFGLEVTYEVGVRHRYCVGYCASSKCHFRCRPNSCNGARENNCSWNAS